METNHYQIFFRIFFVLVPLLFAPLAIGVINKTKAFFAGRKGVRVLQLYYDIFKLLKKEHVYSESSNFILRIAPLASLAFTIIAMLFLPLGAYSSPFAFAGDIVLFFYLLATARFLTVLAALETASSFEGMGASREMQFSALAEGTLFTILTFLVLRSMNFDLSSILLKNGIELKSIAGAAPLFLVGIAFFILLLCENCRVPFDDPETHLELTMIHEAMVLDYGGPDLAVIFYGASLKFWLFATFFTTLFIPVEYVGTFTGICFAFAGVFVTAVITGIVESCMARSRFLKLPQLLTGAAVLAVVGILLQIFFGGGQ